MTSTVTTDWPQLSLDSWLPTYATLHRWTQIVGKTRLRLAPMVNHWWQVVLYVTPRGLTTTTMPYGDRALEIAFDFIDHHLVVRASDGATASLELEPQSVAEFHARYFALLRSLGVEVRIHGTPNEIANAIPFAEDREHASYDRAAAERCWRVLLQSHRVIERFRGAFLGKCSPVHFWWGSFDLACTRFSGRPAPPHPGGFPGLPDRVTREAYSHECISAGFWPGSADGPVREPAYYAYSYPEPAGCADSRIAPAAASWHPVLHEWILPYAAVRGAADPDAELLQFLQSTYVAAAGLGGWDRAALERSPAVAAA